MPKSSPEISQPAQSPEPQETIELSAEVAGLAFLAATSIGGLHYDSNDNEAERQVDGSVKLSIRKSKSEGGGHQRVYVIVPETLCLKVRHDSAIVE